MELWGCLRVRFLMCFIPFICNVSSAEHSFQNSGGKNIDSFDILLNSNKEDASGKYLFESNERIRNVGDSFVTNQEVKTFGNDGNITDSNKNKGKGGWFGTSFCKPQTIDGLNSKINEWSGVTDSQNKQLDIGEIRCAKINSIQTDQAVEIRFTSALEKAYEMQNNPANSQKSVVFFNSIVGTRESLKKAKEDFDQSQQQLVMVSDHLYGRIRDCASRGKNTDFTCCESTNPKSMEIRNMIGVALPALSGMSAKLACSKFSDVMVGVGGLMTAWNLSCASIKISCESACDEGFEGFNQYYKVLSKIESSVNDFLKVLNTMETEINTNIEKNKDISRESDYLSVRQKLLDGISQRSKSLTNSSTLIRECAPKAKNLQVALERQAKQCQAWGKDMATSLLGIGGLILQAKQKSKCGPAEEPNTCNPAAPTAATCAAFCADAANKSNPACRCILNPLASGCMDGSGRGYANGGGGNFNAMNFNKPGAMAPGNDTTTNPAPEFGGPNSGGGGGGPSGRGGGGGGGLGGGSVLGSSGRPTGAGAAGKGGSRIDPNVISGFEGGGGASGGSKAGGGYGANSAMMDKLKSELKAKADKLRGLASEDDPRLQITGAGGKTNWEKISDRYRDMTGQMIKDD